MSNKTWKEKSFSFGEREVLVMKRYHMRKRILSLLAVSTILCNSVGAWASAAPAAWLYGDVDDSGKVEAADALLALQASTGKVKLSERQRRVADVDGSGGVSAADALFILQYTTSKIKSFPVEEGKDEPLDLTKYVDMTLGSSSNTHTVIGPQRPNASVNPSPDGTGYEANGYTGGDIRGFSQMHVSGTGVPKYGQVLLSPQVGLATRLDGHDSPKANEQAGCSE